MVDVAQDSLEVHLLENYVVVFDLRRGSQTVEEDSCRCGRVLYNATTISPLA